MPEFLSISSGGWYYRLKEEDYYGLALALGGSEITMEEMLKLYAMITNGEKLKPIKKLFGAHTDRSDKKQLLSAESSFLILDILKDNPAPLSLIDRLNIQA